ncbi:MAG: glycosyltransferase family 4 protein [Deltaproteobacteria bacterium]|nr:glycosyltransferase family 4 protein [Deltaproteobacteria bacterium]
MSIRGLFVSIHPRSDRSAYTHRLTKLARCLEERGMGYDFLCMQDSFFLRKSSTASFFLLAHCGRLRQYDFIHCGDAEAGQALFWRRHFLNAPIILDIHGDVIAQSSLAEEVRSGGRRSAASLLVRLFYWMAVRSADQFLTVSGLQTKELIKEGIPPDHITLVRNGVDLDLFRDTPVSQETPVCFAYAGGFQTWQGIDYLIEAFARVDRSLARLLVVGFQEQDIDLKRDLAARFGPAVKLIDKVDQERLIEILRSAAILVIPRKAHRAIRHAFPTKFAEYAALGRPILVNDVDETAEFVRKYECGFVARPSPEGMAQAMLEAAATPRETLQAMGARARRMAEECFSWNRIGDVYADTVRALVAHSGRQNI